MGEQGKKGGNILDQFAAFLQQQTAAEGNDPEDFAVNLRTTDKDGATHELTGIPISRAGNWIYDKFGIGPEPTAADDDGGQGDGGQGDAKTGGSVIDYFRGAGKGQRAAGGTGS